MAKSPAERQREFRERHGASKGLTITINLDEEEAKAYLRAYDLQIHHGTKGSFTKAAFMRGCLFVANSGQPKGKKMKK